MNDETMSAVEDGNKSMFFFLQKKNIKIPRKRVKKNVRDKALLVVASASSGSNIGDATPQNVKQRDILDAAAAVGKAKNQQPIPNNQAK